MSVSKKKEKLIIVETPQDMLKHIFAVAELVANSKSQQEEDQASDITLEKLPE